MSAPARRPRSVTVDAEMLKHLLNLVHASEELLAASALAADRAGTLEQVTHRHNAWIAADAKWRAAVAACSKRSRGEKR